MSAGHRVWTCTLLVKMSNTYSSGKQKKKINEVLKKIDYAFYVLANFTRELQ